MIVRIDAYELHCDGCKKPYDTAYVNRSAEEVWEKAKDWWGWKIERDGKHHCPDCAGKMEEKNSNMEEEK